MQVTHDGLASAVLAVMQREGLDGVNMRAVAAELGVRAPSLYFHVRDKNALLELAADALITPAATLHPDSALDVDGEAGSERWRRMLRERAGRYRDQLLAQRDSARLLQGRFGTGPRSLAATEAGLALLVEEGFDLDSAAQALFLVFSVYTVGFVAAEQVPMNAAEARGFSPAEALASAAQQLRALPAEQFPHLQRSAEAMFGPGLDERFARGLEMVLEGVAAAKPSGTTIP